MQSGFNSNTKMFSHLSGWRVNVSLIQEMASKELLKLLEKCEGTKAIVWDEALSGPVGLITKYSLLKERNVVKMLQLRPGNLPNVDVRHIIFITRPNPKLMDYVADNVHSCDKSHTQGARKEFHLYFLPKISMLCEKHLKIKGVYGSFTNIGEFKCDIFPVDCDLLSMELNDIYREIHLDGDPTSIYAAAGVLVSLQKLYGRIPKVIGKGTVAQKVWQLAKNMGKDETIMLNSGKGSIDQLILIDRSIDLMSVLATQLTYEGLIDEFFGISQATAHFPAERFSRSDEGIQPMSSTDKKSIILISGEELYTELRDNNFRAVGQIMSKHAKNITSQLDARRNDKTVQEIKLFVERLPNMLAYKQSVVNHTIIAEMIQEAIEKSNFTEELHCEQEFLQCADLDRASVFIEDLIAKKGSFRTIIRLICMQCIAGSGLKQKILDYYKRELVQVYGIQTLLVINNLEKAGILKAQAGSRPYTVLRKTLRLTVEDGSDVAPKDISYVHTLYAPLSIRIIEQSLKPNGWQDLNDILGNIPGPTFEDYQTSNQTGGRRGSFSSEISQNDAPRVILVFFLGGCTFAEISALRFLSKQEENNVEFIIATTKLINKNTFLDSFIENIVPEENVKK